MPSNQHGPRNEVVVVSKSKKNTTSKNGEKTKIEDQGRYCEFNESIGHDTVKLIMLQ